MSNLLTIQLFLKGLCQRLAFNEHRLLFINKAKNNRIASDMELQKSVDLYTYGYQSTKHFGLQTLKGRPEGAGRRQEEQLLEATFTQLSFLLLFNDFLSRKNILLLGLCLLESRGVEPFNTMT